MHVLGAGDLVWSSFTKAIRVCTMRPLQCDATNDAAAAQAASSTILTKLVGIFHIHLQGITVRPQMGYHSADMTGCDLERYMRIIKAAPPDHPC